MKISYNWLKTYIDVSYSPQEVAEKLTMVGLTAESVTNQTDDYLIEFDITSNRSDSLSHYGMARELAAISGVKARLPKVDLAEGSELTSNVTSVEILNPELCPRYTARVIKGVKVAPSPEWLVKRLESVGQRSINNIADITNFVLLEQGQPLHAFDFNKLAGHRIVVRTARAGETLKTLDGIERKLREDMLIIADGEKPTALGGIMGGEYSEISLETTDVLLECAYFAPSSVRRTARVLDMKTEASYRFERGADYDGCVRAINRCAQLVCEIAGGTLLKNVIDAYPQVISPKIIELHYPRIAALTGLEVEPSKIEILLNDLGFQVTTLVAGKHWRLVAPSFRGDINIEEDLVEEIARHIGYDQIPLTLPTWNGAGSYLPGEERRRQMRDTLIGLGYGETISFSWVRAELDAHFRSKETGVVMLKNSIDEERPQMRTSLLPGLIESLTRNFNFGNRNIKLFEVGKCFQQGVERPSEYEQIAFAITGQRNESDWQHQQDMVDFYDIKGTVEALVENCGLKDYKIERSNATYLHSGQAAQIKVGEKTLGHFGQLSPSLRDEFKFKQQIFVAELAIDLLLSLPNSEVKYTPLPKLQAVNRDISFLLPEKVSYEEIQKAIIGLGIKELVNIKLFDIYAGKNLPASHRSLSISLRYQPNLESMTDQQINELDEKIIALLVSTFNAQLRR
ncbi:MAG: phenylalanine--tRNA ligase subunit beta [Acidobacteria bacterium]|nr:phenylalanine--tRNA ligase subunit beta [Acidobacteriota bacterium]